MSTEFTVTCAAKAFGEWIRMLEEAAGRDVDMPTGKLAAIGGLREAYDRFNTEFKDDITP